MALAFLSLTGRTSCKMGTTPAPRSLPMTHDEAFLQAIIESHDDDAPRLIYADWLEDHGQPERADFIRAQVALATMPRNDPRRQALKISERRLQERHEWHWAQPFSGFAEDWKFRRGFVEGVTISAHVLHDGIGKPGLLESFCQTCLRELELSWGSDQGNYLGNKACEALAGSPLLGQLRSLALTCGIGDQGVRLLAASPHATSLTCLTLSRQPPFEAPPSPETIGVQGVRALIGSRFWAKLVRLGLQGYLLTDAGAREFLTAPRPPQLALLSLVGAEISERLKQDLRNHFGESVCRFS
jgi:uncharacterized protein (TIGR02996 family)